MKSSLIPLMVIAGRVTLSVVADDFTTDFEAGYLRGWTRIGTAFDSQPTRGDNPTARGRGQPSNHADDWWIGTYENYQGRPGQIPGDIQNDGPTGTLTSPSFLLTGELFTFLVGGGTHFMDDPEGVTAVVLEVDGATVFYATGDNNETMVRAVWNVSSFKNRRGVIKVIDTHSGAWGHINCDDFQMLDTQGRRLPFSTQGTGDEIPALTVHALPSGAVWSTTSPNYVTISDSDPPSRTPKSSLACGIRTDDHADLKITVSGELWASPGARVSLRALVDGAETFPSDIVGAVGNYTGARSFTFVKPNLAAGGHWVEIQWAVDTGATAWLGDASLTLSASSASSPRATLLVNAAPSGGWLTTTYGYWTTVPNMTGTIATKTTGNLAITFSAEAFTGGDSQMFVRAVVDGKPASPSDVEFVSEWFYGVRSFTFVMPEVPAGNHAVEIQWHGTAAQTSYVGDRTLSVVAAPLVTKHGGLAVQAAPSGPDQTTTSVTWTDVPHMVAYPATAANSSLEITFSSELNGSANAPVFVRALVDGHPANPSDVLFVQGESWGTRSFTFTQTGLTAGPHDVRMQWRVNPGGTGYLGDHTMALNYWRIEPGDPGMPAFDLKPVVGTRKVLAILWDPHRPDHPAPARNAVENLLYGGQPSVQDYFRENSGGRLQLENAGVLGWYDAVLPATYYWGPTDPGDGNGDGWINPHVQKWAEAIRAADANFNFAAYDRDRNGVLSIEELAILIIIPQNGPFGTMNYAVGREVPRQDLIVDGVKVSPITEAYIGSPPSLGLVAHELAHLLLNAGDMYFYFFQPYSAGMYSLMDDSPSNPGHLDPLHKLRVGWLTPRIVTSNRWYQLRNIESSSEVLLLYDPAHGADEYFLVENRWGGTSYDSVLPYSGLAVWQVIEDPAVYGSLPTPPSVDPTLWNDPAWTGWARRGIRMIRPIYGPPHHDALWDGTSPLTGYDLLSADPNPNHVSLRWADGTPSGFSLVCLPAPGPETTVAVLHSSFSGGLSGPPLTMQNDRRQLRLSWPAAFRCFELERANALPAPAWFPVTPLPQIVGDENVVTIALPHGSQYYRLRKP